LEVNIQVKDDQNKCSSAPTNGDDHGIKKASSLKKNLNLMNHSYSCHLIKPLPTQTKDWKAMLSNSSNKL
jgi:hypothetical protein